MFKAIALSTYLALTSANLSFLKKEDFVSMEKSDAPWPSVNVFYTFAGEIDAMQYNETTKELSPYQNMTIL